MDEIKNNQEKIPMNEGKRKKVKQLCKTSIGVLLGLVLLFFAGGCQSQTSSFKSLNLDSATSDSVIPLKEIKDTFSDEKSTSQVAVPQEYSKKELLEEDGSYTSKNEVALYLHQYRRLPQNFITKKEAIDLGWENSKGNLDKIAPGKSIGGDRFGNREGILPEKKQRKWRECDIDYKGGFRGGKRIVFSNDGEIYYSKDHYKNFVLLYGTGK